MTVEEATARFPREAGIARYGTPEEIAELMAFIWARRAVSPPSESKVTLEDLGVVNH